MVKSTAPKVSIGLPVYNGENYLRRAIESILSQTFKDWELIICDNASTDSTTKICEYYEALDERIGFFPNPVNQGASWNFNRCFNLSSGEYFKWCAHDDILEPSFLERCVERLDAEPTAVLCHSHSKIVDDDFNCVDTYDPSTLTTDHPRSSIRFGGRVRGYRCTEVFGLIRSSALKNTKLIQAFVGSDRALLAELAIAGRFLTVPEYLFFNGHHPDRSTRVGVRPLERFAFYAPVRKGAKSYPTWSLYGAYLDMIKRHVPKYSDQVRCYGHLVSALFVRFNLVRLVIEPIWSYCPWIVDVAVWVRQAFHGTGYRPVQVKNPKSSAGDTGKKGSEI